jgi:hypothetical protein
MKFKKGDIVRLRLYPQGRDLFLISVECEDYQYGKLTRVLPLQGKYKMHEQTFPHHYLKEAKLVSR